MFDRDVNVFSCTQSIGDGEIRVFANLLHSHLLGYGIKTRVVRQGKELPPMAQDNNYDFNYQEMRKLQDELVLRKVSVWRLFDVCNSLYVGIACCNCAIHFGRYMSLLLMKAWCSDQWSDFQIINIETNLIKLCFFPIQ